MVAYFALQNVLIEVNTLSTLFSSFIFTSSSASETNNLQ